MRDGSLMLKDRRALVTGSTRGIGAAIAGRLAASGAVVCLHGRSETPAAKSTLAGLAGSGHVLVNADLAIPGEGRRLVAEAATALGGLDIVVNNAGIYTRHEPGQAAADFWDETWRRTLQVNLTAPAAICHAALEHLPRGGHLVNISSRGAYRGEPEAPGYGAAKAGLNALTQSLALALGPRGIVVVGVAPGWVASDMTRPYLDGPEGEGIRAQCALGRTATAAEVAEVVLLAVGGRADALAGAILDVNAASHLR